MMRLKLHLASIDEQVSFIVSEDTEEHFCENGG